ncbi:MAG: protein translocase subunit SecF [Desulfobacteraceae bacterium]|jgi:preprotein translocase subunit SecF|nr:MAG: protein translocase subunit SecF [Desulfobacteraceae bacterium]
MYLIKPGISVDFIGKKNLAFFVSGALILLTIFTLIWRGGPNYGVDFSGGVLIQIKLPEKKSPSDIKAALKAVDLEDSIVQEFGGEEELEYLIRVRKTDFELTGVGDKTAAAMKASFGEGIEVRRVEMVGPKVGKDLTDKALFAIFYSILFMAIYISGRFELKWLMSLVMALSLAIVVYMISLFEAGITLLIIAALVVTIGLCWLLSLKFALGAIIALVHDVIITVGAFAITNKEIDLSVIAAILTIVGYSMNDTIIVFDRIRENTRRYRRKPLTEIINESINQTLSRTILTAGTTLIVVVALFFLGGGVIHDFAYALLVGIIVGTYSSIYVASPLLLLFEKAGRPVAGEEKGSSK